MKMRMGTSTLVALTLFPMLAAVSLLILPSCGGEAGKSERPQRLTLAIQTWVGYGPLYLAAEKGFFAEDGLDLVFVHEDLDAARSDAFRAGMLDVEAGTIDVLVNKRAAGLPVVAVAPIDYSLGADAVVATSDIHVLADLVGKKVALARDNAGEIFLSYLFHQAGLPFERGTIVSMAPDKAAEAFLNAEVDAAVTWEPWVTRALAREGAHVLVSTKDEPEIIVDVFNVREELVREKPDLVRALLRGWYKALDYYRANPDKASAIIAPYFNLSPQQYREQVAKLHWVTYSEALKDFGTEDEPGRLFELFDTIASIKRKNARIARNPKATLGLNSRILLTLYDRETATR